jgi:uncharacterized protein YukE
MTPGGDSQRIERAAITLVSLASDVAAMQSDLQATTSAMVGGWRGQAADAFVNHMGRRGRVLALAGEAISGMAGGLAQYAKSLSDAQQSTERAKSDAVAAGLHLSGDQVDPHSLWPPTLDKAGAAANLERQLAESEAVGAWASSQLLLALRTAEERAGQAKALLSHTAERSPSPLDVIGEIATGSLKWLGAAAPEAAETAGTEGGTMLGALAAVGTAALILLATTIPSDSAVGDNTDQAKGRNQRENAQAKAAADRAGLNDEGRDALHREISNKSYDQQEIDDIAKELYDNYPKYRK